MSSKAIAALLENAEQIARQAQQNPSPQAIAALINAIRSAEGIARNGALREQQGFSMKQSEVFRPLPCRILRPAFSATVATGVTTAAQPITWPASGVVVGICGGTVDGTAASLGAMSVRITATGKAGTTTELFTDGQAAAFANFATTFGSNGFGNQAGWWPCEIPFGQGDIWQVYFKNESAAGPFSPVLEFAFAGT